MIESLILAFTVGSMFHAEVKEEIFMSIDEINMKCNDLCGKSASEITSGLSGFYGESGMGKSVRRIIRDMQTESELKTKNAYSDGRNKGRLEGGGGTAIVCLVLGTVLYALTKAKQSKERKAVWEANRQIRDDIIDSYEERLRHVKETYEQAKEELVCSDENSVK